MLRRVAFGIAMYLAGAGAMAMEGNVQFLLGQRGLDDIWTPLDRQPMFGVQVDFGQPDWPVHLAFAGLGSADQDTIFDPSLGVYADVSAAVVEASAGFLWLPMKKKAVRPFLGAGLAAVSGALEYDYGFFTTDDNDASRSR